MTFGTEGGGTASIRVPNARADLTKSEIRAAMTQILNAAAVQTKTGRINSAVKAVVQTSAVTGIDLVSA